MKIFPVPPEEYTGNGSLLQSRFWGSFKASFGWRHHFFRVEEGESSGLGNGSLLALERRFGRFFSFAYIPFSPPLRPSPPAEMALEAIARSILPFLSPWCVFVRFDLPWELPSAEGRASFLGRPLFRSGSDVQPPDTVILDLKGDEEELLAAMKPKWRYNIRLAGKKGVEVRSGEEFDIFYEMYRTTAKRDRISIHTKDYYARLLEAKPEEGSDTPDVRLWIARHEGEALAGIITAFYRGKAMYLYGASSDAKRNFMPAYALQWEAIRAAKQSGCSEYDFFGIPPSVDGAHPMAGLYRFKTGFGGRLVHRGGGWDFPMKKELYGLIRGAEGIRSFWHKNVKKRFRKASQASRQAE